MSFRFEELSHPIRYLFLAHAVSGLIALLVFLIPLASRKGGSVHIRAGWVYTYAMVFVGISSLVITPWRAFFDPERSLSSIGFAVFLFFISIFTLCSLWYGLIVLKFKERAEPSRFAIHIGPPILLIVLGLGTQALGVIQNSTLLVAFPFLGHVTARAQLKYWLSTPQGKMHWWYAHMNGMFTACIATITAFLVTALPRVWSNDFTQSPILWIAPGLILGTILNRWTASYRAKFDEIEV